MSPYTIRNWLKRGLLDSYTTPGGHHRILRRDLDAFILARGMPLPEGLLAGRKRLLMAVPEKMAGTTKAVEEWSGDISVLLASSGFDIGMALVDFIPHVVLVDLDSERWSGLEICRRILASPNTCDVQVAALTVHNTVETLEVLQDYGVLATFSSPLAPGEFRAFLKKIFPYCRWIKSEPSEPR